MANIESYGLLYGDMDLGQQAREPSHGATVQITPV